MTGRPRAKMKEGRDERWGVPGTGGRGVWRLAELGVKRNGDGRYNRRVLFYGRFALLGTLHEDVDSFDMCSSITADGLSCYLSGPRRQEFNEGISHSHGIIQ